MESHTRLRVTPPHGSRARYLHRSLGCRCAACRQANTVYQAGYRLRVRRAAAARQAAIQLRLPAELLPRER